MNYKTLVSNVEKRSTIPILSQIRVIDKVATATDLDIDIDQPVDLPDGCYYHQGFSKGIFVKSKYALSDFPSATKTGSPVAEITIDEDHIAALKWILLAASTEETRYYLNGLCFSERGHIVATDGHRMHCVDFNGTWLSADRQDFIVPRKAVKMMLALCAELDHKEIKLTLCDRGFIALIGNAKMRGKIIDGTYPDYKKVMPAIEGSKKTHFDQETLLKIMPEINVFNEIEYNKHHAGINIIEGRAIYRSSGEIEGQKDFPIDFNLPFPTSFNAKYLSEIGGGTVYFSNNSAPFLFISEVQGIKTQAALMPMMFEVPASSVVQIRKKKRK